MADPACGTGAAQLETRPPRFQLLRAGQTDEESTHTHHPGGGANPCGGGRWDRGREEEPEEDLSRRKKRTTRVSVCRILEEAELWRPLLATVFNG